MFFLFYLQHRTPLHCAAGRNKTDCMLALIDKGGAFIDAITGDPHKNVRFLLLVIRSPI
jgi:ankyrin repeat protein